MGRISGFLRLSFRERWLLAQAYVYLLTAALALRFFSFQSLTGRSRRSFRTPPMVPDTATILRAGKYAAWIDLAARHNIVRALCLQQSLALHFWLAREETASEVRIGVRKDGDTLVAHAWVVIGDHVVNDHREAVKAFLPLTSATVPLCVNTSIPTEPIPSANTAGDGSHAGGVQGAATL